MMSTNKKDDALDQAIIDIDLGDLEVEADTSDEKEAYYQVSSGDSYRLGAGISASPDGGYTYSIELLVRVFTGEAELQILNMEQTTQLSQRLKGLGYSIRHENDGWLSCERTLRRDEITNDCRVLTNMLVAFKAEEQELDDKKEKEG